MRNNQSCHFNSEIERLKTRFADIIYRHVLKKAARMHLETIYDKIIRNEIFVIEKNNAQKNELQSFRKICSKSDTVRRAFENRIKNYSKIQKRLKYQLNMKRHSRQCFEHHIVIFTNSLKFMSRFFQTQFSMSSAKREINEKNKSIEI